MGSPREFMRHFRQELHAVGVRFAITSGQACVYFGIQQTTKDSDWIIRPEDLSRLRAMLVAADTSESVRVSYRAICGAPLDRAWMSNGWTSHVAITDADSQEHHLDFFSKAPRVNELDHDANDPDYASRQVVAQMKKTDRQKDWPIVFALGRQAISHGDIRGVLHGQNADWLVKTWNNIPDSSPIGGTLAVNSPTNSSERDPGDPQYPEEYYEFLEQQFGAEKAAWARLPRAERDKELTWIHENYDTPDDLDEWPPELGGGVFNP